MKSPQCPGGLAATCRLRGSCFVEPTLSCTLGPPASSPRLHRSHAQRPPHIAGLAALHHHCADQIVPARRVAFRKLQGVQGEEDAIIDHPVPPTEAGHADLQAQHGLAARAQWGRNQHREGGAAVAREARAGLWGEAMPRTLPARQKPGGEAAGAAQGTLRLLSQARLPPLLQPRLPRPQLC